MGLDHRFADGQAESRAVGFSMGHEWLENTRQPLSGNPATSVGNLELQAGFGSFDCKRGDLWGGFRHPSPGVGNEIAETPHEPVAVRLNCAVVENFDP